MKARIHLFEHEQTDSLLVMNKTQEGQPLYIRFDGCEYNEDLSPCDLLVVSRYVDIEDGDICLVYDEFDETYTFDEAAQIVRMSDLDAELRDVFIGKSGGVIPLENVEKVMAASSDSSEDSLVPYMEGNLIAECIFAYNTGEQLDEIFINQDGSITFDPEDEDEDEDEEVSSNGITYISEGVVQVGEVIIQVDGSGVAMVLADPDKNEEDVMVNIPQLSNIVGYILTTIRDLGLKL